MLYKQISDMCTQSGTSISRVEKEVGLGNGTIGKWKKVAPSAYALKRVADYFGVTVDELLKDTTEK